MAEWLDSEKGKTWAARVQDGKKRKKGSAVDSDSQTAALLATELMTRLSCAITAPGLSKWTQMFTRFRKCAGTVSSVLSSIQRKIGGGKSLSLVDYELRKRLHTECVLIQDKYNPRNCCAKLFCGAVGTTRDALKRRFGAEGFSKFDESRLNFYESDSKSESRSEI
jgi:hypothetical protein